MKAKEKLEADLALISLGLALTDTLDDLINDGRIEPQLAMKILSTFDRVVTEVLADRVRARLTFKVHYKFGPFVGGGDMKIILS